MLNTPKHALLKSGIAASVLLMSTPLAESAPLPRKMTRQIEFFETITSSMLVDSPNFLVYSGSPARGLYLDEYGLLVTFDASLVQNQEDLKDWWKNWSDGIRIEKQDGKWIVYTDEHDHDDDRDEDGDREAERRARKEALKNYEKWQDEKEVIHHQLYEAGKNELILHLLDYGDTVRQLKDDQWVTLVAYLTRADYFEEQDLNQLVVKARMSDLRAYADGHITEEQAKSKIIVEEY